MIESNSFIPFPKQEAVSGKVSPLDFLAQASMDAGSHTSGTKWIPTGEGKERITVVPGPSGNPIKIHKGNGKLTQPSTASSDQKAFTRKCRNRECQNMGGQVGKPRSIYCSKRCQSREQNLRQGRIKNVKSPNTVEKEKLSQLANNANSQNINRSEYSSDDESPPLPLGNSHVYTSQASHFHEKIEKPSKKRSRSDSPVQHNSIPSLSVAPNSPISNLNINPTPQVNNNNNSSNASPTGGTFTQPYTSQQQNSVNLFSTNSIPLTTSPSPSPIMMQNSHINLHSPSPIPSSWSMPMNLNSLSGNSNTPSASMFNSLNSISPSLSAMHMIAPSPSSILPIPQPLSPLTLRLGMTPSPSLNSGITSPLTLQNAFQGTPPPSTFAPIPMSSSISGQSSQFISKPQATPANPTLVRPSPVNAKPKIEQINTSQDDNLKLPPIRS